jgi:hypothetical protein
MPVSQTKFQDFVKDKELKDTFKKHAFTQQNPCSKNTKIHFIYIRQQGIYAAL